MRKASKADVWVPALLVALSLVPALGGALRFVSLARPVTPESARFVASPGPIVIHVICATLYSLGGAFQFSRGLRVRWPGWHRRAGRVLALAGLLAGATGLWMTISYAIPSNLQGSILYGVRLVVGSAMVLSIVVAWRSILRRDVARHEAFMIRAYALGQGAGTQALVLGPWMMITGQTGGPTRDVLMALCWAINLAVAEGVIQARRRAARRPSVVQAAERAAA